MPTNIPQEIQLFISDLWHQDPLQRPTFQEASKRISNFLETSRYSSNTSFAAVMNEEEIPPEGNVCVVCTRVFGSESLWEEIPEKMAESVVYTNTTIKQRCQKLHGFINQNDGENFVIVFQDAVNALRFCTETQVELNEVDWASEITAHECCRSVADGQLRGLRVQMGLDFGECTFVQDETTRRRQYTGKTVSKAMKISRSSQGGQIVFSEEVYQALSDNIQMVEVENTIREMQSKRKDSGLLYEIFSKKLSKRGDFFHQIQTQMPSIMISNQSQISSEENHLPNTPAASSHANNNPNKLQIPELGGINRAAKMQVKLKPIEAATAVPKLREKKDWEIDYDELVVEAKSIGSGSFGSVFVAVYKGNRVAVKKVSNGRNINDHVFLAFMYEIAMLRRLRHPNIISLIGASIERPNLGIVTELVEPGNLRSLLQNRSVPMGQQEKKSIIDGIISGMTYLHSLDPIILHRDLKSANVLVNEKFESKICDFGFAKMKENNRTMTKCGTMAYQAPEVLKGKRYNEKADVYSFGILLWEIETRETPYQGRDPLLLQFEVIEGLRPEIRSNMDSSTVETIKRCWDADPNVRPHFRDLMSTNPNDIEVINV